MISALLIIVTALTLAYLLAELMKPLGLPRSVGQIAAGLILSIGFIKSLVATPEGLDSLAFLANLGIILLFYYVGLETNFKVFTKHVKSSLLVSIFNTAIPLILGFVIMKFFFHYDNLVSLLIGISLSVSAQAVSVDILEELNLLKSKIGNLIIGTGAIDDAIELVLVTVLLSIFHFTSYAISPLQLAVNVILFILAIAAIRIWILPKALKLFDADRSSTTRFAGAMILVLLIVTLTETLNLGTFIGAIIAGVLVRQTIFTEKTIPFWEEHDITKSIHILAFGFLVPLFFVWIGMNTNIALLANVQSLSFVLLLTVLATVGTIGGTVLATVLNKGTIREGTVLGWGLNAKGDIELVIASLALQSAIITQEIFSALVLMSFLTTIISPIVFRKLVLRHRKIKSHFVSRY